MNLTNELQAIYSTEKLSALDAQRKAEFIAWSPVIFQVSRLMVKWGILEYIESDKSGRTRQEIVEHTGLSDYAVKCLTEASLCIGTLKVDTATDKFTLTKTGWFFLNSPATKINTDFNHDVNYIGLFDLEKSLQSGRPEGLKHFGTWSTIYEGLSSLPDDAQKSWFNFDHFYSDASFDDALRILFDDYKVSQLYDVGGNTGKFALRCVAYSQQAHVTILDLPQQLELMRQNVAGKTGANRISGHPINLLCEDTSFPSNTQIDGIWMSQFLDCFSMPQIVSILSRATRVMTPDTRLFIMETLWDRQRFDTAALCLTMTSLYFTAMANGNSKMYNTEDMTKCIAEAGLEIEKIHDGLGHGHSILVCRKKA